MLYSYTYSIAFRHYEIAEYAHIQKQHIYYFCRSWLKAECVNWLKNYLDITLD